MDSYNLAVALSVMCAMEGQMNEPIDMTAPPCRVCGEVKNVYVWRDEAPEQTICNVCCENSEHHDGETGHHYSFGGSLEGHTCDYCGQIAPDDYFYSED